MRKIAILLVVMLLASLAVAQAPGAPNPPRGMDRWWARPGVIQQLGLTDAQIKQLDQLAADTAMKLIDDKAAVEKAQVQLLALFIPDKLDEAKFNQTVDTLLAAETRLKKTAIGAMLQGYNLLTPEQQQKLKMLMQNPEFLRRMMGGLGPGGMGPGRGMGVGRGVGPGVGRGPMMQRPQPPKPPE